MTLKLDNPVWYSLAEANSRFSIVYGDVQFYDPDYCPFGAFDDKNDVSIPIDIYSTLVEEFYIVGAKPTFSEKIILKHELVCHQMVLERNIDWEYSESIVKLNDRYEDALFSLVNLVQPGFFKNKTALMGDYYGIFRDKELVAVTGERMKMNDFTEVSAVVTHPAHTGKGYAKQLVAITVNKILGENKIPYLHVNEKNSVAISLYERVGFKTRRKMSFWNLIKRQ